MKGATTVQSAVRKASKVSKRKGKWANQPEIKHKIASKTFKEPVLPILKYLVKQDRIEKKKGFMLWRPKGGGLTGLGGDDDSTSNRSREKGRDDTYRSERKTDSSGRRSDSKAERGLRSASRVATAASFMGIGTSVGRSISSTFM